MMFGVKTNRLFRLSQALRAGWLLLGMTGLLLMGIAQAQSRANQVAGRPALLRVGDEPPYVEHRERRLERALRDGKITPEEADRLRERWRGQGPQQELWGYPKRPGMAPPDSAWKERRKRLVESLTPPQRQQFEDMQQQDRQARERLEQGLSDQQRERMRRRHELSPEERRELFESLTPEQREQIKSHFKQRRQAREQFFNSLTPEQRSLMPPPMHPSMDKPPGGE